MNKRAKAHRRNRANRLVQEGGGKEGRGGEGRRRGKGGREGGEEPEHDAINPLMIVV